MKPDERTKLVEVMRNYVETSGQSSASWITDTSLARWNINYAHKHESPPGEDVDDK